MYEHDYHRYLLLDTHSRHIRCLILIYLEFKYLNITLLITYNPCCLTILPAPQQKLESVFAAGGTYGVYNLNTSDEVKFDFCRLSL